MAGDKAIHVAAVKAAQRRIIQGTFVQERLIVQQVIVIFTASRCPTHTVVRSWDRPRTLSMTEPCRPPQQRQEVQPRRLISAMDHGRYSPPNSRLAGSVPC